MYVCIYLLYLRFHHVEVSTTGWTCMVRSLAGPSRLAVTLRRADSRRVLSYLLFRSFPVTSSTGDGIKESGVRSSISPSFPRPTSLKPLSTELLIQRFSLASNRDKGAEWPIRSILSSCHVCTHCIVTTSDR